jgi:F-type H+-transporting ATPase subunit gamma
MASILDLKRRIRSVKNTRQITKAMKMVAAAKLRRAQERMVQARPYATMLASVLVSLKRRIQVTDDVGELAHPLLSAREEKNVLLLVVSGEKGFAGAFSANILKAATRFLADNTDKQIDIQPIGRKAREYFRRRFPDAHFGERPEETPEGEANAGRARTRSGPVEITGPDVTGLLEKLSYNDQVRSIGEEVVQRYADGEIDAVYLVYNEFRSVISQRVVTERILPLLEPGERAITAAEAPTEEERAEAARAAESAGISLRDDEAEAINQQAQDEDKRFGTANVDYLYEQPPAQLLSAILPRFVTALIYHAMLESAAAEQAARMTAMDNATNNASDMIDSLTLTMNRARQAAITKEIIEIVSGAAAV